MKIILALFLVLFEAGLVNSNATGFLGKMPDMAPKISRPDSAINSIDSLLKKFNVDDARRQRVAQAIVRSSHTHNLDARLVASILIVESHGNPFAISRSDAVGIMQIHVPTWARTVDEEGINLFKIEDNIDFGARILKTYVEQHGRDEGIKRYNGWIAGDSESEQNAEAYLQRVQRVYLSALHIQ
jgi:soluble lytic murein transglycosylase-like protein